MKVKVLKKHIVNGEPEDGSSCAVALALKDKGFNDVVVGTNEVLLDGESYSIRRGQRFITKFDAGLPVKPCTIELTQSY